MEEGAKRRLVGAAVMVLLVVVFVPMLLEEDAQGPVPEGELSIPERPDFDQGYDTTVADGPDTDETDLSKPVTPDRQPLPQELPPPVFFDAPAAVPSEEESEQAYEPVYELEPPPSEAPSPPPEPQPAPAVKSPPPAASGPLPIAPGVSAWVIQVASLQDVRRAKSLERDLREKGFPAFIERAEVKQKLWHRIRVGPEADRKRAESIAASIKAQMGLTAQIHRYP